MLAYFRRIPRETALFLLVILLTALGLIYLLSAYFRFYSAPHMMGEIIDLSSGWQYSVEGLEGLHNLETLRTGPGLEAGQTIQLYRTLNEEPPGRISIMIRANHQYLQVYLDDDLLYADAVIDININPGMALHYILLPEGYITKTLRVQLTSPYALYSGRTGAIFMGLQSSLEAFALASSMRSVILMAMCLLIGIVTILLTFLQGVYGSRNPQGLAVGIFAVVWGLYYVCTEYIAFWFFPPFWMSALSLGLYFSFQAPLALYFYFSFSYYRKWMLPACIVHCGFPLIAILLQALGVVDMPALVNLNNILLSGLVYTTVLVVLEAVRLRSTMIIAAPFMLIAYISMLMNFHNFYTRHGVPPYSYRDTYFLLVLCILGYTVWQFFNLHYRNRQENDVLAMQSRLALASHEQIKTHMQELGGLKHDIRSHLAMLQTYLSAFEYDKALRYLENYMGKAIAITEAAYHPHYIVNAMAGSLLRRAKEQNTEVKLNLKASPVNISEPDLYSLLSNLIDNALESCAKLPADSERFIHFGITQREPYICICMENSYSGEISCAEGVILSTKTEPGHGYGLWIIRRIAESYEGFIDTEYDATRFIVTVLIKE